MIQASTQPVVVSLAVWTTLSAALLPLLIFLPFESKPSLLRIEKCQKYVLTQHPVTVSHILLRALVKTVLMNPFFLGEVFNSEF